MGRKKHLEDIDAYNKGYIDASMNKGITVNSDILNSNSTKLFDYKVEIKCKNKKQKDLLKLLKDESKQICIVHGSAGSGKSYISLAYALSALKDETNNFDKIIITVPTLQAVSSTLNLGFLRGDLNDKVINYLMADSDTMEKILKNSGNYAPKDILDNLIKSNKIEYRWPHFMRGATYDNSLILINESEGFDKNELLLILTRLGNNSKVIISGDEKQAVRKDFKDGSGMKYAIEHLSDMEEVGIIEFTDEDIVRNPLIGKILDNWK